MKIRIAAAALVATVASLVPAAAHAADKPTLIAVHVTNDGGRKALATANCTNQGPGTSAYAKTGWKVQGAKTAHLNGATVPAGLSTAKSALQGAFNAWTTAEPAAPRITVATDGAVTTQTANHRYDVLFGSVSGGAVAITYTWTWSSGEIESDTVFNRSYPWFIAASVGDGCTESVAKYDLANVATHEFGHTYGLDHVNARFDTMYPYVYTGETLKRTLAVGDSNGIRALY
jgi:hypothetical protein